MSTPQPRTTTSKECTRFSGVHDKLMFLQWALLSSRHRLCNLDKLGAVVEVDRRIWIDKC